MLIFNNDGENLDPSLWKSYFLDFIPIYMSITINRTHVGRLIEKPLLYEWQITYKFHDMWYPSPGGWNVKIGGSAKIALLIEKRVTQGGRGFSTIVILWRDDLNRDGLGRACRRIVETGTRRIRKCVINLVIVDHVSSARRWTRPESKLKREVLFNRSSYLY